MPRDGNKPSSLTSQNERLVGILVQENGKLQLHPTKEKGKSRNCDVNPADLNGAVEGDIVLADPVGNQKAKVTKILGTKTTPKIFSLVSLYEQGLSDKFNDACLKEAQGLTVPDLQGREDLRNVPLVTVDGTDSRDFDDAIYAEDTADGGKHLIVAIADVSWYVRAGSELDKEALKRGNSTYFPDMVVPMLPEAISNGLCSLKPNEDRACMVYHLWIDKEGNLLDKKINRGLMRSAARLTYDQLQAAKDGNPDAITKPLMNTVVNPLYDAYEILKKAADKRGMMNLEIPVSKPEINEKGETVSVADEDNSAASHDVIAQFMILANVAGDMALNEAQAEAIHRFHSAPPPEKITRLNEYLEAFGLVLPSGEEITDSRPFQELIEQTKKLPNGEEIVGGVMKAIARAQAKAVYNSTNDGHFGLALPGYGHHTSPIRRYADLINHRSLVAAFNMGAGALNAEQKTNIQEIAEHISETEVLSATAERNTDDRFAIDYLSHRIGETFEATITGVANAGVFVRMKDAGPVEGLVPMRNLPVSDFYEANKEERTLTGKNTGQVYSAGDTLTVRLLSADSITRSIALTANDNSDSRGGSAPRVDHRQADKQETAAALQGRNGETFKGKITGVSDAGLFVRVDGMKADGLVPFKKLPNDYYTVNKDEKTVTGRDTGKVYRVGDEIDVRLVNADVQTSRVTFSATNDNQAGAPRPQAKHQNKDNNNGKHHNRGPKR